MIYLNTDALRPILRTALVINWPESAMIKRYDQFIKNFPEISTLLELKRVIDNTDPLEFCITYLDIKAKSENNPKYLLLKELTNGFLEYKHINEVPSEIDAIRHWTESVDIKKSQLKKDFIGRRHGVGPGVVENIRLCLGYNVIKPDRHVEGVMKQILKVDIPYVKYKDFADEIEIDSRYLDCLLFKYGKAKLISTKNK